METRPVEPGPLVTGPFTGNITILTGASRGIGEALAYQLAEQGSRLALAARDLDRLNKVAEGLWGHRYFDQ
jgi:short-subunit dehydrogenase